MKTYIFVLLQALLFLLTISSCCEDEDVDPCDEFLETRERVYERVGCIDSGEDLFKILEIQPQYQDGLDEFGEFLNRNVDICNLDKIEEGKMVLGTVIRKDGTSCLLWVMGENVFRNTHESFIGIIDTMTTWIPGSHFGSVKHVQFNIPIVIDNSEIRIDG